MKYKNFNTYDISSFMSNHLLYKYDDYEDYEEENQSLDMLPNFFIETQFNENNEEAEEGHQEDEEQEQDDEEEEGHQEDEEDEHDYEEDYEEVDSVS